MYSDTTGGRMDVIDKRTEAEIEVRKSRFIAIAMPTGTLEEVKEHVREIWKEHLSGKRDHSYLLWSLLIFSLFLEHK